MFLRQLLTATILASVALLASADLPLVQSNQLRRVLTRAALKAHGSKFESFAILSPDNSRSFGSVGHNTTVDYIKRMLDETGYYNTELQTFSYLYSDGEAEFSAAGKKYETGWFTYSPAGNVTARIVNVANLGCKPENFPISVKGNIALIRRGTCEFGLKVAYAGAAGAAGVVIYNNIPGETPNGSLSKPSRPEGPYVPAGFISLQNGTELVAAAAAGNVTGVLGVNSLTESRYSSNVLATTKGGNKKNVVFAGAHSDSVPAGPGINDNGSGAIGLLEIALQLPKWSVKNAVRFGWWTAEEVGLVGSDYYIKSLDSTEVGEIALYLNADMIASPNFGYFVYDGDGSTFNITGPPGSANIQRLYKEYFTEVGLPTKPTAFDGRSDYGPFLNVGIPCGGLFSGAEGKKTVEEVKLWGGKADVAYDENYHKPGDTLRNTNLGAWIQNTKALAHSIAEYARDLQGIPRPGPESQRLGVHTEITYWKGKVATF